MYADHTPTDDFASSGSATVRTITDTRGYRSTRQWAVVAAVLAADSAELLPVGVVVAGDLDLATDQMCARLPLPPVRVDAWYLVAIPATVEPGNGRLISESRAVWVNRVDASGARWHATEWEPAEGYLAQLDPRRIC